uniref:Zinc finger protein 292a n=1 Tax=Salarias fasciatus TaxID=181472 RepID=A0A672H2R8_SALFA
GSVDGPLVLPGVCVDDAGLRWKTDEDSLPLLEVYTVAILSFAKATSCLSSECENVPLLLEKLALSCAELLVWLKSDVSVRLCFPCPLSQLAHSLLQESGSTQLCLVAVLAQQDGVWSNSTLSGIMSDQIPETEQVHEYLELEGPTLLSMRIKHLIKVDSVDKAALLAKTCAEYPGFEGKGNFKQTYLLCICMIKSQEQLMEEIASIDCKDALEMICNLESEGDEKGALCLCTAFLKRQLLQGDVYCAWELTLFWSKLLMRLESSADSFLGRSKEMALLCRSVCHILFLIKVVQNEVGEVGLPVCVEMCIQALKMTSSDHKDSKSTICKTISCLLPTDLEVKRACQLTEFLVQPTVDSYYAVESLYNEPDQKPEEDGSVPVPNSLRCELLLALKTQWPFDPEFWDWKTLKRNCLALMGEEAAIVSSIDTLNDTDDQEVESAISKLPEYRDLEDFLLTTTNELNEITDEREKNREAKKLREQGFVSARFRNWRAYMQYCVLCDKEFLGHRIVRHAQKHFKDGVYLCPICADSFESREVLEPHVASHVKQSCKERLAAMKAARKVTKPSQSPKSPSKIPKVIAKTNVSPVKVEPQMSTQLAPPVKAEQPAAEIQMSQDCFCPVKNCSKAFKFFRNLMAHVRSHKDDEEAMRFLEIQKQKVVCQYCRRQFVNVRHLNDHLQMHCGTKPYICIQLDCKANFNSNSELLMHRKTHPEFKAQCMFPNCGQVFSEAYLLYDHEAQHYLTYTCQTDNCGKIFYSQSQFLAHQQNHYVSDAVNSGVVVNQAPLAPPAAEVLPESATSTDLTAGPMNSSQGNEYQKATPQMISPSQIKTEIPCSLQGYPSGTPAVAASSEENLHCCPYKDCTRAYSTNKSLSRHVKKQHPEIFEDWKLAKKYNKVAKITAKKESCSLTTLTSPIVLKQEPQNPNIMEFSSYPSASPENPSEKAAELTSPTLAVPYQQDHLMEISHAFQRLDLIEATQEKMRLALSSEQNASQGLSSQTAPDVEKSKTVSKSDDKPTEKVHKPFKCDQEDCEYSFMTKEALFKHLTKMHDYSNEMIEELKRTPSKLSPYPCQICPKTFTRTTGLRIHYEKVHRLSKAEMQKLKISARNRRAFRLIKDEATVSKGTSEANSSQTAPSAAVLPSDVSPSKERTPQLSPASASVSPEKPSSSKNTPMKEERKDKIQKRLSLKMCDADNAYSPYRPYRCVHEGCTAAFTIQHNLILHYRAMHQAALPPSKPDSDSDVAGANSGQESVESIGTDQEVRCQVKNCSRVFMGITRLVQHYLLLHKFTRDKATAMMASMSIETFNCDRPECALPFDSVEKYIEHIKNFHKEIAISERGSVDPTFRCEYEGCDRVYTTKSNLLRHLIKKHEYVYDPKASDGRRTKSVGLFPGLNNGKENVENKFKVKKKNAKKKEAKSIEHWTSFGKPTLKSHEEASAMCTKKFSLQYPCMIIGCDAVERAERSIFRHYATHGLTERYIEDQRSQFIFCKKYSRSRFKDANKAEGALSSADDTEPEEGEKPAEAKTDELEDRIGQEDSKLSNDDSAESQASTGMEGLAKRGRPRKPAHPTPACPQRIQTLRNRPTVNSSGENSNPGTPTAPEPRDDAVLPGSFKPLGLEDSFLKFLETSESTLASKRKSTEKCSELPSKRQHTQKQRSAIKGKITGEFRGYENLVDFRNPLNLKSASNVKIVMDRTLSGGADLLLKQLQDMKPMVIIKKWLYSAS